MHGAHTWSGGHQPQRVAIAEDQQRDHTGAAGSQLRALRGGSGCGPPALLGGDGGTISRRGPQRLGELGHRPLPRQVPSDQRSLDSPERNADYHPGEPNALHQLGGRCRREITLQLHQCPLRRFSRRPGSPGPLQVVRDRLTCVGSEPLHAGHRHLATLPGNPDRHTEHHDQHGKR